jgi:hypothetical protein
MAQMNMSRLEINIGCYSNGSKIYYSGHCSSDCFEELWERVSRFNCPVNVDLAPGKYSGNQWRELLVEREVIRSKILKITNNSNGSKHGRD